MDEKEPLEEKIRRVKTGRILPSAASLVTEDLFQGVSGITNDTGLMDIYRSEVLPWREHLGYDARLAQLAAVAAGTLGQGELEELLMVILIEPFAILPRKRKEENSKWRQQ